MFNGMTEIVETETFLGKNLYNLHELRRLLLEWRGWWSLIDLFPPSRESTLPPLDRAEYGVDATEFGLK